ncbi:putative MFS family arabinose efflux permease [Kitasatospora sp. MAP12-15]|uniref:MFS transporter n=1 Tax=unclassified Kitasatospora TaxID=2633591 RepID=UPI002475737B|nr:MFS transporter [Kitasatospora sp. MAP12-44]MDH6111261.1 putative MFS family arabinose efflux permease [Kitasatospora sp. MAP12-44]
MFSSYRRLLAVPGAVAFTCFGLLSRLSFGMLGISVLTMVVDRRGSYATAGAVSAAGLVGTALALPLLGRLVDRHGQARTTVPAALLAAVPRIALLLCAHGGAPDWTLYCCAFASAAAPNVGGMARARWAHLLRDDPAAAHVANSLEQALDELCFMTGPVLGVLLCGWFFPEAGLLAATVLSTLGALLFAAQRRTEPPLPAAPPSRPRSALRTPGTAVLVAAFLAVGAVFGALEVSTAAYLGSRGHQGAAGALLGLLAAGSCASGLVFGLLRARRHPVVRFLLGLTAMAALMWLPLAAAGLGAGTVTLAAVLFVAGTGTAPTMVTGMTLLQQVLPADALNEGMAFAVSGIVTGISVGSATAGLAAQRYGPATGYAIATTAAALALLLTLAGRRRLRPARPYAQVYSYSGSSKPPGKGAQRSSVRTPPARS